MLAEPNTNSPNGGRKTNSITWMRRFRTPSNGVRIWPSSGYTLICAATSSGRNFPDRSSQNSQIPLASHSADRTSHSRKKSRRIFIPRRYHFVEPSTLQACHALVGAVGLLAAQGRRRAQTGGPPEPQGGHGHTRDHSP